MEYQRIEQGSTVYSRSNPNRVGKVTSEWADFNTEKQMIVVKWKDHPDETETLLADWVSVVPQVEEELWDGDAGTELYERRQKDFITVASAIEALPKTAVKVTEIGHLYPALISHFAKVAGITHEAGIDFLSSSQHTVGMDGSLILSDDTGFAVVKFDDRDNVVEASFLVAGEEVAPKQFFSSRKSPSAVEFVPLREGIELRASATERVIVDWDSLEEICTVHKLPYEVVNATLLRGEVYRVGGRNG